MLFIDYTLKNHKMQRIAFGASALLSFVSAANEDYPRMKQVMDNYKFTWEAVEVETDDGYTLTTFHVTGNEKGKFTPTKSPILIMHGAMSDAAAWVGYYPTGTPMMLQLAEEGYDIWLGNNRGTEYSQKHKTLTVNQPEFWHYTW